MALYLYSSPTMAWVAPSSRPSPWVAPVDPPVPKMTPLEELDVLRLKRWDAELADQAPLPSPAPVMAGTTGHERQRYSLGAGGRAVLFDGQQPPRFQYHGFSTAGPWGPAFTSVQYATLQEEQEALALFDAHIAQERAVVHDQQRQKWREAKRRWRAAKKGA